MLWTRYLQVVLHCVSQTDTARPCLVECRRPRPWCLVGLARAPYPSNVLSVTESCHPLTPFHSHCPECELLDALLAARFPQSNLLGSTRHIAAPPCYHDHSPTLPTTEHRLPFSYYKAIERAAAFYLVLPTCRPSRRNPSSGSQSRW